MISSLDGELIAGEETVLGEATASNLAPIDCQLENLQD